MIENKLWSHRSKAHAVGVTKTPTQRMMWDRILRAWVYNAKYPLGYTDLRERVLRANSKLTCPSPTHRAPSLTREEGGTKKIEPRPS